jgi:dimethylamine corrinoid protein
MSKAIIRKLAKAVVDGDIEATKALADEALKCGVDEYEALNRGLSAGLKHVGDLFEAGICYLPNLLMSADAMKAGLNILQPHIKVDGVGGKSKVVIGTTEGDIHDIGKNIVKSMFEASGLEVYDLGTDVKADTFVSTAKEVDTEIIAMSALMSTTMIKMKDVLDLLVSKGVRKSYLVMVGGGAITQAYAKHIGADGYAEDAVKAARVAADLLKGKIR